MRPPILATLVLALAALAPLAVAHATTQTTSFSQTISFDGVTVKVSGTITVDTTAKTLSATVTLTEVNSTTGATIFSKTFTLNLSFATSNSLRFVLNIPAVPLMLAASCTVNVGSPATCMVSRTPDLNHDGTVDFLDASMLAFAFGSTPGTTRWNPAADLNADGQVDILDAALFAADYGAPVY